MNGTILNILAVVKENNSITSSMNVIIGIVIFIIIVLIIATMLSNKK